MKLNFKIDFEKGYKYFFILLGSPLILWLILDVILESYDVTPLLFLITSIYQLFGFAFLLIASYGSHIFDLGSKTDATIERKELFKMGILFMLAGLLVQTLNYYFTVTVADVEFSPLVKSIISFVNSTANMTVRES